LPKETNQRKGSLSLAASLLSAFGGYPVLLKKTGRCETRGVYAPQGCSDSRSLRHFMASLTARAIPVFSALLGCVKWQSKTNPYLFVN